MQDAKDNHRGFGMEKKLGSERQDNRTLLGTLYLDIFWVMEALQLVTRVLVLTHGRAARGSPTTTYTLLRDTGLENVRDLESCMRDERSSLMESVFIPA